MLANCSTAIDARKHALFMAFLSTLAQRLTISPSHAQTASIHAKTFFSLAVTQLLMNVTSTHHREQHSNGDLVLVEI